MIGDSTCCNKLYLLPSRRDTTRDAFIHLFDIKQSDAVRALCIYYQYYQYQVVLIYSKLWYSMHQYNQTMGHSLN